MCNLKTRGVGAADYHPRDFSRQALVKKPTVTEALNVYSAAAGRKNRTYRRAADGKLKGTSGQEKRT